MDKGQRDTVISNLAKSNKHPPPQPPNPPQSTPLACSPCLFAKWKRRALRSLSINLKRPDNQWCRRHSIFLLNWANQLICLARSGDLRRWQKLHGQRASTPFSFPLGWLKSRYIKCKCKWKLWHFEGGRELWSCCARRRVIRRFPACSGVENVPVGCK